MAKFVYLQFHNDMALQNAVIEYEVGKEIIFINQDTFLPGFKAETMSHFQQEVLPGYQEWIVPNRFPSLMHVHSILRTLK